MAGVLDKFYVEHGVHGAGVVARWDQLTANCMTDHEIDAANVGAQSHSIAGSIPWPLQTKGGR